MFIWANCWANIKFRLNNTHWRMQNPSSLKARTLYARLHEMEFYFDPMGGSCHCFTHIRISSLYILRRKKGEEKSWDFFAWHQLKTCLGIEKQSPQYIKCYAKIGSCWFRFFSIRITVLLPCSLKFCVVETHDSGIPTVSKLVRIFRSTKLQYPHQTKL